MEPHTFTLSTRGWIVLALVGLFYIRVSRGRARLPLPPGPTGYPPIGLSKIPKEKPWLVYKDWSEKYGDVMFFKYMGQPFLVLSSLDSVSDLLEKRSAKYSDRPSYPLLTQIMEYAYNLAFIPYGQRWREHRKAFHEHFHLGVVDRYQSVQVEETHAFLTRLLNSPEKFDHHINHLFASTIMRVAYGIEIGGLDDPYIHIAEEALQGINIAAQPGAHLVDYLPILKSLPTWMPGTGFQHLGDYYREVNNKMVNRPFDSVKQTLRKGSGVPSIAASFIEDLRDGDRATHSEEVARNVAAVIYSGGSHTTASAALTFFLAMTMYPDVQLKAQQELDQVVGNRMPEFNDHFSLPYIEAIVKETIRWQIVLPLGVPHTSTEDDEYRGYFIPKGTIVTPNVWAIMHNPGVYSDPMIFRPERFLKNGALDPEVLDPATGIFGFGRRICPGRHFSNNALFILASSVLSVFDISAPRDEDGNPIQVDPDVSSGIISYPNKFRSWIKPRSQAAESRLKDLEISKL